MTTVAVIPAGGSGTRLWPRSRRSTPKHVLPLADRRRPLLRATYDRARAVADEVFVLTEMRQREIIEAVLPEVDAAHMILEPSARGTTNAYGLATLTLVERAPGAVMIGLPADHVVHGSAEVARTVRAALRAAAKSDCLVTVGLKPTFPSTGLGYIHAPGRPSAGTLRVKRFIEKPSVASARRFVRDGGYYWNLAWFSRCSSRSWPAMHLGIFRGCARSWPRGRRGMRRPPPPSTDGCRSRWSTVA